MPNSLKIQLLGSFHLIFDKKPVKGLDSPRLQSFLAYLLINCNTPQSRQKLAFLFWPDSNESQARTNLRNMLFKLRGAFPEVDDYLEINQQTLWWKPDSPLNLDLDDFKDAVEQTNITGSGKDQKAHRLALTAAVEAYTGDLLPSCYDDWVQPERDRLRQAHINLLEELAEILEADEDIDQAILYTRQLIQIDNLAERYYQNLMRLYFSKGDKSRAVRTYHQCVEVLEKEMGFDPSSETQKLYLAVMSREKLVPEIQRITEKKTRLIGRSKFWNEIQNAWLGYQSGTHLVVIMGEAGIGKTYLADEFLRWAKKGNITCLKTRSYPTEDELAFTPVAGLLRNEVVFKNLSALDETRLIELARLLPELRTQYPDLPDPDKISENWKRGRLFEASALSLLNLDNKIVVLLDDLQWCDRETLDWLRYILALETEKKIMILAGVRTEDLLADSILIPFLSDLSGLGKLTEILLERLDLEQTHRLASDMWGEDLEDRAGLRLFQETEGNPFFIAEMVRAGYLKDFGDGTDLSKMPPKVQAVIESRLNALSSPTRDIAAVAAAVGRGFDFELLFRSGNLSESDLLVSLDELWGRRLIRDEGESGYNFSHDKFREVLYSRISPHRKAHYHKKIGSALEEIHQGHLEMASPQLAYHYNLAGNKNKALDYYLMAGDQARLVFAQDEALQYYQSGAEILEKKKDSRSVELFSGIGKTLIKLARYEEAAQAFLKMSENARSLGDCEKEAESWLSVAKARDRLGEFEDAILCANKAAEISKKEGCQTEYANAILMKGQQYYRKGEVDQAEPFLKNALGLHQENGNKPAVGRCLNLLGLIHDIMGKFDAAKEYKEQAISIFMEMNDIQSQWEIGNLTLNLAITANLKGDYQEAIDLYFKAEKYMAEFVDDDWRNMWLFNVGASYVNLGQFDKAEDILGEVLDRTVDDGWLGLSLTYFCLAESYFGQGQIKYAHKAALEALRYARQTQGQEYLGAAWRVLGKIASENKGGVVIIDDKETTTRECFQKSVDYFQKANADGEKAHTLKAWSSFEKKSGEKELGNKMWAEARNIFKELDMTAEVDRMDSIS